MALTNAEKQARFRARRAAELKVLRKLDTAQGGDPKRPSAGRPAPDPARVWPAPGDSHRVNSRRFATRAETTAERPSAGPPPSPNGFTDGAGCKPGPRD
jgi:hypothetical protein